MIKEKIKVDFVHDLYGIIYKNIEFIVKTEGLRVSKLSRFRLFILMVYIIISAINSQAHKKSQT